jgi:hypothetical protein
MPGPEFKPSSTKNKTAGYLKLMPVILTTWLLGRLSSEDYSSRPEQANSSQDPVSKITGAKWIEGKAQAVKYLLCKHKALNSKPSLTKKTKPHTQKLVAGRNQIHTEHMTSKSAFSLTAWKKSHTHRIQVSYVTDEKTDLRKMYSKRYP